MKSLRSSLAALIAILLVGFASSAYAQFAAGDCVVTTNGGKPSVVLGPSNVAGQFMVRDLRLPSGTGQSFRPDQLQAIPCPGPAVVQNACFQSDAGAGASELEQAVRGALVVSLSQSQSPTTVAVDRVAVGDPRMWSTAEIQDFEVGDPAQGIVDVRALYRTCVDLMTDIRVTRAENNFVCFVATATGELTCEMTGATPGLEPTTIQALPKQ